MALKTYVGMIERLEKFKVANYLRYLLSEDHDNHIGRTEIISNSQDPKNFFRVNAEKIRGSIKRRIERRRKKSRGWHNKPLTDSNRTLVFSIPVAYEKITTKEKIIEIQKQLMEALIKDYAKNGIKVREEDFFSNIHLQRNNHINFIIPGLDSDYKIIKHIRGDSYRYKMANEFTKIVDKVLGTKFNEYDQNSETLAVIEKETEKMENDFYSLEDLARLKEEKGLNKHLKRLYDYFYRAAKAEIEAKDNAKTLLRAENTLQKLEAGESIEEADKQHLRDILGAIKGGNILTEQEKRELKKGTKGNYQ